MGARVKVWANPNPDPNPNANVYPNPNQILLPPMLGMAYALVRYRGQECKYLSYRFSHSHAKVRVGYMPKERREALWAEITAGKIKTGTQVPSDAVARGARDTTVQVPMGTSADPTPPPPSDTPDRGGVSAYRVRGGMFTPAPTRWSTSRAQVLQNPVLLPKLESQKV